jgi:cytochrome c oxidase subunit III
MSEPTQRLGRFAMTLFLVALGVLFAASMVGYLVVRLRAPAWPPAGSPRLPAGLWISTLLLLLSSLTMHLALGQARAGRGRRLRDWLLATSLLGLAFLVSQVLNWIHLITVAHLPAKANLYAFTFYMLSGLHGAHVLGGLIPLGITATQAHRGRYTTGEHEGVVHMSMYWHFLDAVWLVMFAVLMIAA